MQMGGEALKPEEEAKPGPDGGGPDVDKLAVGEGQVQPHALKKCEHDR